MTTDVEAAEPLDLIVEASAGIPSTSARLFQHRFGCEAPSLPHHVSTLVRRGDTVVDTLCYIHFAPFGTALLGGGACVNSAALRALTPALRMRLKRDGGAYAMTLRWALSRFQQSVDAVFGYCGDRLAERIDLACGFERTPHRHLLVFWCQARESVQRASILKAVAEIGPF